jgi:hypothetical protein
VRAAAAWALAPAPDALALASPPLDPVRLGIAAQGAKIPEGALARPEGRRAYLPRVLRERATTSLLPLAEKKGDAQLDALAALGRSGTADAIAALARLATKEASKDEGVRKAAYRALRRAQRIAAKRKEARP